MAALAQSILEIAASGRKSTPVTAREFLHLGSRAAIDQALSRLARTGQLLRVGQGLYVQPVRDRFGQRTPTPQQVLKAIAEQRGEHMAPSLAATANALGLTTQVPLRTVYLTSGRSRRFTFGALRVELRHAPPSQLREGVVGDVVRALAWSGKNEAAGVVESLGKMLSAEQRREVVASRSSLPTWMAQTLSPWVDG